MFWWNIDRNWLWICHSGRLFCFRHACRANLLYHLRIGKIPPAVVCKGPGFEWRVACREQSPRYTRICSLALCRRHFDKTILNRFIFATGGGAPGYSSIVQSVERMTVNLPLGVMLELITLIVLIASTISSPGNIPQAVCMSRWFLLRSPSIRVSKSFVKRA